MDCDWLLPSVSPSPQPPNTHTHWIPKVGSCSAFTNIYHRTMCQPHILFVSWLLHGGSSQSDSSLSGWLCNDLFTEEYDGVFHAQPRKSVLSSAAQQWDWSLIKTDQFIFSSCHILSLPLIYCWYRLDCGTKCYFSRERLSDSRHSLLYMLIMIHSLLINHARGI